MYTLPLLFFPGLRPALQYELQWQS